jgi:hypothetical protein
MTDYTPGPWHYATKGPGLLGAFAGDDLIVGVASSDNQEANARLIAAAPDMLALLENVVPVIESSIRVGKGFSDPEPWLVEQIEYLDGLLADVHAAIAKARGE